jgi:putative DNA primase/helicase
MNDLEIWLKSFGCNIVPIPDGRIHRFDRDGKKNAWFWGVCMYSSKDGSPYYLATVGDWRTDEKFEFKTNAAYSKEDAKLIAERIKSGAKKAEKEKLQHQLEVADLSKSAFNEFAQTGTTPYLSKKQIPELYGCRVDADTLIVPARDAENKLWGFQRIYQDGKKYFQSGQRKEGCFHVIPSEINFQETEVVYVCEGFATGASIYQATGKPVVVAFDAGNLLPVASSIMGPTIIICGDDDQWTDKNPGREKAEAAAKKCLGKVWFPKFADTSTKPTDANDLHILEGLAELKKQIDQIKVEKHYIIALGYNGDDYYYTSSSNKQIVSISSHGEDSLLKLQPLAYWETVYPGTKTRVDWSEARSDLMNQCRSKGIFYVDNIRGPGIWRDRDRTVLHLGNRLLVDGELKDIHAIDSRFIYELSKADPTPHKDPLTAKECQPIVDVLLLLNTERMEQKFFLGGWIVAAHLCGILSWRPHLVVTGQKGSGKSTIVNEFMKPLLADRFFGLAGGTTEAGIRQKMGSCSKPIVYDEFESDSFEEQAIIKRVLGLIRQASTDSGYVIKGSATGNAVEYTARFCALVSAIFPIIESSQDKSRFTQIDIKPVTDNRDEQWKALQKSLKILDNTYCQRFFSRIFNQIPLFLENLSVFEKVLAKKHSMRFAQQYGPLLAGWWLLTSDTPVSDWDALTLVDEIKPEQELGTSGASDEETCLDAIMDRKVFCDRDQEEMTIGEIIKRVLRKEIEPERDEKLNNIVTGQKDVWPLYNKTLELYGLYMDPDERTLFVSSVNVELAKLMFRTRWPSNWNAALRRLPQYNNAENLTHRFGVQVKKGIKLRL